MSTATWATGPKIPPALHLRLKRLALEQGRTLADLVAEACEDYLQAHEPPAYTIDPETGALRPVSEVHDDHP